MQLLNTLYVTTQRAYLHLDHDTVRVDVEGSTKLQVPLLHLGAMVCFGDVAVSTALLNRCAEDGRSVVFMDRGGRFRARVEGPVSGNVLLRRAQHLTLSDDDRVLAIARNMVAGKIQNSRQVLLRAARETSEQPSAYALGIAAEGLSAFLNLVETSRALDPLRGYEGEAAATYFAVFDHLIREDPEAFALGGRTRRPPLSRMNALLSFIYALLRTDCVAALEGVGLDPQVGYLHALRPGRPALGLDLMEELRAVMADRLALSLVNRRQLQRDDFVVRDGGAVSLADDARKVVVIAYQKRKQEDVQHRALKRKIPFGMVPHVQARLLARTLRGDLEHYPPYLYR